ncbi:uncharacterized protein PV09_08534 [Verruconis gallopava]|uniref:Thioredoxin domain-containing protein n=1 Tax=Verruconis gallopava TaxID=253628 RepID=A0A0D1YGE3_9PEZI|nr:uncharacterized protein PV09_08534 [Verruconis gallopava]KIV99866.1 hypothetical protein PV09_08534 [Verruconis gallopava]
MDAATFAAASAIPRWPAKASKDYINARNDLLKKEYELRAHIERVAALRRSLPKGALMRPYDFDEGSFNSDGSKPARKTSLADLAADGRSVVLYHFMYDPEDEKPCGMCSMIVDSFNGVGKHLAQNVNFAVVGKAELPKLQTWAQKRGWKNIRILSSHGTTFNADMNVERPVWAKDCKQMPGVSVFKKDEEGNVRHVYTAYPCIEPKSERGLDLLATTYNVLDLTPEGRGQWYATNEYV